MESQSFIRQQFSHFYEENAANIEAPSSLEQREFGFFLFEKGVVIRHKGFANVEKMRTFIKKTAPSNAYYSTAYYRMPERKMEDKGWLGADLYFDIDADHISTKCKMVHDSWICKNCDFAGKGSTPPECPSCGNKRFDSKAWPCESCLETTKTETRKLVDILAEDFGFSLSEIEVAFSGHRGYHVHVEDEAVRGLDSAGRKEMVDYITGVGLEATYHGLSGGTSGPLSGPRLNDPGWQGRIAKGMREFLLSATEDDLRELGLKPKAANEIVSERDAILQSWDRSGPWNLVKGLGKKGWKSIANRGVKYQSTHIDTVVTTDIHRLIRLPKSLHGKTGWLKIMLPSSNLESFDPLKRAIAFRKGAVRIYVDEAPYFRIAEEEFGPFKNEKVELPLAAAMFLLCKGAGEVVS